MNHCETSLEFHNTDWAQVQRHRHGTIRVGHKGDIHVAYRWWAKRVTLYEARIWGAQQHAAPGRWACRLYYTQPRGSDQYLVLTYVVSSQQCSLAQLRTALIALDHIALIKRSDAILCQVTNPRISSRLLRRWGWEPQQGTRLSDHWIKRFYGDYGSVSALPSFHRAQLADQTAERLEC